MTHGKFAQKCRFAFRCLCNYDYTCQAIVRAACKLQQRPCLSESGDCRGFALSFALWIFPLFVSSISEFESLDVETVVRNPLARCDGEVNEEGQGADDEGVEKGEDDEEGEDDDDLRRGDDLDVRYQKNPQLDVRAAACSPGERSQLKS